MSHETKQSESTEVADLLTKARGLTQDQALLAPIEALGLSYRQQMTIEAPLNPRQAATGIDLSKEFEAVAAGRRAIRTALGAAVATLEWKLSFAGPEAEAQELSDVSDLTVVEDEPPVIPPSPTTSA